MRRITQLSSVWEASNYTQTEELETSRSHLELLTVSLWGRQRYVGAGSGCRLRNWGHLEATSSC